MSKGTGKSGDVDVVDAADAEDKRVAFTMKLQPDADIEVYKQRHIDIWPELVDLLDESGVYDYSIFFDDSTNTLFGFQRVKGDAGSQDLGQLEIVQEWWKFMSDIMVTNDDNSPVTKPMVEVFRMD